MMRHLYPVMVFAQSSPSPYISLLLAGPVTPWKGVNVQLTGECTLLRRFFNDAKFVVFELRVGKVIPVGAGGRLPGCASEGAESRGLPVPPL